MLSKVLDTLFLLLLVAGVPALSYRTAHAPQLRLLPRTVIYKSAILSQWILATLAAAEMLSTSRFLVGFRPLALPVAARWTALLVVVSLACLGFTLLLERHGWWPRESRLVYLLMPETRAEKMWAIFAVSPTAAICEEFLYRGFLLARLQQWFHSVPASWLASSALFGLAHIYQGPGGVARAAVLGAVLAYPLVHLGSLYPSMAAHCLIDAAAFAWLGPELLKRRIAN